MTKASWSTNLDPCPFPVHPLPSGLNREIYIKCKFVYVTAMLMSFWGHPNRYSISVQIYHNKWFHLFLFLFILLVSTHHLLLCSNNLKWGKAYHPYRFFFHSCMPSLPPNFFSSFHSITPIVCSASPWHVCSWYQYADQKRTITPNFTSTKIRLGARHSKTC